MEISLSRFQIFQTFAIDVLLANVYNPGSYTFRITLSAVISCGSANIKKKVLFRKKKERKRSFFTVALFSQ